jgi:uncharacterized protein involved in exopolysaccharide biosynthesis
MSSPEARPGSGTAAFDAAIMWGGQALAMVLKVKTRLLVYAASGGVVAAAIALLLPTEYTSTATFIAQGSSALNIPAGLLGAAASLGLEKGNDYSPKFYADLLTSRPILTSAILHEYPMPGPDSARGSTYLQIEGFDNEAPARAMDDALRHLGARVSATTDVRTNLITLVVRARSPRLSRDVAAQLLRALDSLNVGFRQGQSRESREFYETRVQQTRQELADAESAVRAFMQQNRVAAAPSLQFELQRLQREAELKQNLYATVVQQYEQARLQEARNIPTLTVLSEPFVPVRRSAPNRRFIVVLGLLSGILALLAQLRVAAAWRRFREEEPESWETVRRLPQTLRRHP